MILLTKRYQNRSLARAFSVIDLFDGTLDKLTAKEIADRLRLTVGGLYPTLYNLTSYGYLVRDKNKRYSLGLKFLECANQLLRQLDVRAEAQMPLRKLSQVYDSSTHLSILYGWEVIHLYVESVRPSVIFREAVGTRIPAYCTGVGKALLAHLDDESLHQYLLTIPLKRLTMNTIVEPDVLQEELAQIRSSGVAFDRGEFHEDVRCVAAPVFDYQGKGIAAISLSMLKSSFCEEEVEVIASYVSETALEISRRIGFIPGQTKGGSER